MRKNVVLDKGLRTKMDSGKLSAADRALLALADTVAGLFSELLVYLSPVRQNLPLPAWFARFYEASASRLLGDITAYEFSFELKYWPKEPQMDSELMGVLYTAQQGLRGLSFGEDYFTVQRINGTVVDRTVPITGVIRVMEQDVSDAPYIEQAERNVRIS